MEATFASAMLNIGDSKAVSNYNMERAVYFIRSNVEVDKIQDLPSL